MATTERILIFLFRLRSRLSQYFYYVDSCGRDFRPSFDYYSPFPNPHHHIKYLLSPIAKKRGMCVLVANKAGEQLQCTGCVNAEMVQPEHEGQCTRAAGKPGKAESLQREGK